jgi:uncharacterized protein (DUF1778 family)
MDDLKPSRPGRPHSLHIRLTREEKRLIAKAAGMVEPSVWARAVLIAATEPKP